MTIETPRRRPATVTGAVVLLYLGGIAQIGLGVVSIFLRYSTEVQADGLTLAVTLTGAGMALFGLFMIAIASGVARGSALSRASASAIVVLALGLAVADLVVAGDGDWTGVVVQSIVAAAVLLPLWLGGGRRYFAVR
ncbi:hypothetical protein [Plantibacter sp. ME-Dv--P-122b]|uniref:hypothetical protein n=1 Tax=Plantibacter sp. ME-Dv--P-122b TaxID=3040300 RepID=UPI00254E8772|nr:hypothetical protein [Plantibacter sp. ME-Dv--P-122b]